MSISRNSAWTLPMCREAAVAIAHAHGLSVDVYIEGANGSSAVRFDLHRDGVTTCWVALGTQLLEACADAAAVRALVETEVTAVLRMRHGGRASPSSWSPSSARPDSSGD